MTRKASAMLEGCVTTSPSTDASGAFASMSVASFASRR